jgi:hypothetical protein
MPKFSPQLEDRLRGSKPGDTIEVVLEVAGEPAHADLSKPRAQRMQSMQSDFDTESTEVKKLVENMGGQVLGDSWLGRALKVRVPVDRIYDLLDSGDVHLVDVPRQITRG